MRVTPAFLALVTIAARPAAGQESLQRRPIIAQNGMATTLHPLATQVALDVLKAGGNAVDAVIAANAATGVLLPNGNGVGGDLFAIVYWARDRKVYGINASGRSPRGLSLAQMRAEVGTARTIPSIGKLAVSVPGAVDGWYELHGKFGTRPMADLLTPAIRYAEQGAPGQGWRVNQELAKQPGFAEHFYPGGSGPRPGEVFKRPDLGRTLRRIAAGGREAFYRGEIARTVDRFCRRVGCYLRFEDFADHRSEWVEPVSVTYQGYTVWQLPANTQGMAVLQMLRLLEGYDLKSMGHNSTAYLHHLIEAKKIVYEDRARFYSDPAFARNPTKELLTDVYTARRRKLIDPSRAGNAFPVEDPRLRTTETTYMVVADSAGNMVSLIQSNYEGFGSGLVPDSLGFGLQNRGALFALEDGHPNLYAPGRRPFHTLIPGFVTKEGAPWLAFGSTGGDMQPQTQIQAFLNLVLFGMDVQAAGDAARFRHYGSTEPTGGPAMSDGGCVTLEGGVPQAVQDGLAKLGHRLCNDQAVGGRYLAILRDAVNGVYWGAVESRDYGQAAGY